MNSTTDFPASDDAACSLCGGKGHYMYDDIHGKPCEQCCKHDAGWWELTEYHAGYSAGADNGCCRAGCGQLRRELNQANVLGSGDGEQKISK